MTQEHKDKIRQSLLARKRGAADKACASCGEVKPRTDFGVRANGYSRSQCKSCELLKWKAWQKQNPEKVKALNWRTNLRRWYGLTVEEYEEMAALQSNGCAICHAPMNESTHGKLFVDHCADTGIIRGLLCGNCNTGIGVLSHRIDRLQAAIKYLQNPPHGKPAKPQLASGQQRLQRRLK